MPIYSRDSWVTAWKSRFVLGWRDFRGFCAFAKPTDNEPTFDAIKISQLNDQNHHSLELDIWKKFQEFRFWNLWICFGCCTLTVPNPVHLVVYFSACSLGDNQRDYDEMNSCRLHGQNHHNQVLDISVPVNGFAIDFDPPCRKPSNWKDVDLDSVFE